VAAPIAPSVSQHAACSPVRENSEITRSAAGTCQRVRASISARRSSSPGDTRRDCTGQAAGPARRSDGEARHGARPDQVHGRGDVVIYVAVAGEERDVLTDEAQRLIGARTALLRPAQVKRLA